MTTQSSHQIALVGAVVVTHNSAATIERCVHSLQASGVTQIIVVDNASTDTTTRVLAALPVKVLEEEQNTGFAAACNRGALAVDTPYLLFLNPDAWLTPDALREAVAYLEQHPRVGVAGLLLTDSSGQAEIDSFGVVVTLRSLLQRRWQSNIVPSAPHRCGWVSGGAMVVRRSAWQALGGFDPNFFMYWEDIDLGYRAEQANYQVVLLPHSRVTHQRGHSLGDLRQKTRLYDRSADRYFRKHYATQIWLFQRLLRWLYRCFSPRVH